MKILFAGGGTLGSVSPLIAIFQELKKRDPQASFFWLATRRGLELKIIKEYNIPYRKIFSGKLRRYWSWRNFLDPFLVILGFIQSVWLIIKFKPDVVISAGGYVALPVNWAAGILGRKVIIHQLDVRPTLTNKLSARWASLITVSFESSLNHFSSNKVRFIGAPVREEIFSGNREAARNFFGLEDNLPTVLFIGGGTGALHLNRLVFGSLSELVSFCQVIHITGGKDENDFNNQRYHRFDFLTDRIFDAYAAADLVVSRAGLGSLSELAVLGKPTLLIPMPGSHQQDNVVPFVKNNAAVALDQLSLDSDTLAQAVRELLNDQSLMLSLSSNMKRIMPDNAAKKLVDFLYEN